MKTAESLKTKPTEDLLKRLTDVELEAARIRDLIGVHGDWTPGILLARLHVFLDDTAAELSSHRMILEDAEG